MQPLLSIIVPVYKTENYLAECLDSILVQTFTNFELILVNDGSPDNSPAICDDYAIRDKRVKVIHKANGGLVSARKAGVNVALGRYIGFVDSDDWIEPDMYEVLCKAAVDHDVDIAVCDIIISYESEEIKYKQTIQPGFYNKDLLRTRVYPSMLYSGEFYKFGLIPSLCNKVIRREILTENLIRIDDAIRMGEDAVCTYPCLLDAESLFVLENKYFYHYRQITSSMTRSYDSKFLERMLILYNSLDEIHNGKKVFDLSKQLHYYLTYLTINAINNEFNNKTNLKEKLSFLKTICINEDISRAVMSISLNSLSYKIRFQIWLIRKKKYLLMVLSIYMINIIRWIKASLSKTTVIPVTL